MTRWNDQESAGSGTFLLGAIAGALVGAGVALLMAPKTGAQTREDLTNGYGSVRDAAARRYRDLADLANAKLGELEKKVDHYAGRAAATAEDYAGRAAVAAEDAIDDVSSATGYPRA